MKQRLFGSTGLTVSEIGFGGWAIGGNKHGNSYGDTDDQDSLAAIRTALDLGCTFFDTADVYGHGHSETLLGQALKGRREKVLVATKVGGDFYHGRLNFDPDYIRFALAKSLERLQTSYVDLYQLHNPSFAQIQQGTVFEVLKELKAEGTIRFYGVSIHDPLEGLAALPHGVSAIQVVYNIFRQDAAVELFQKAQAKGVAIIAREPLANSFLTGKYTRSSVEFVPGDIRHQMPSEYIEMQMEQAQHLRILLNRPEPLAQMALKFVLAHPAVSVVIPGMKTEPQVRENLEASGIPDLSEDELEQLRLAAEEEAVSEGEA